ncbi:Mss4-like family protein [Tieghemostelium lacteum]|uniref:Mss4-like family protein n=1 Tax=Tieghemostelium lacteum TaxID=361077 RepID=A0A151ZI81_TIELA|nr:Mss4-like family protein [Tieghemostelium lacteum]|eukprot:KYQ93676.1 Mss4-like family protein [Tieghemostelium lacteum]
MSDQQQQPKDNQLPEYTLSGDGVNEPIEIIIKDVITEKTTITKKNEAGPHDETMLPNSKTLSKTIHCRRCNCTVIAPKNSELVEKDITLPLSKNSDTAEELRYFWYLKDMMQFENVAFTLNVNQTHKYLTCADCESEIIGMHSIQTKENYIAHDRVVYK